MLFKVKPNGSTSPNPVIKTVYGVRFDEKEDSEEIQRKTFFLFYENHEWYWEYAFKFEPVD